MRLKTVCIVIIALILCFIWGNSILPKSTSSAISDAVASFLGLDTTSTDDGGLTGAGVLRKVAHYLEFFALGAAVSVFVLHSVNGQFNKSAMLALCGVGVALVDETIKIFSARGPEVSDIWIDICGYTAGCLLALAVVRALKKQKSNVIIQEKEHK